MRKSLSTTPLRTSSSSRAWIIIIAVGFGLFGIWPTAYDISQPWKKDTWCEAFVRPWRILYVHFSATFFPFIMSYFILAVHVPTFGGGWMICNFSIIKVQFDFLSIEFLYTFSISHKILPYFIFCLLLLYFVWDVIAFGTSFFRARFASFHTHASLLVFFVGFFVLFHSCCSHARVFGKTLLHECPASYSHTEWYLLFSLCEGNE